MLLKILLILFQLYSFTTLLKAKDCPNNKIGKGCFLTCQCADQQDNCNPNCNRCQPGFSSRPLCQKENVAFNRIVKHNRNSSEMRLTDGDVNTCVNITPTNNLVWISVPLRRPSTVSRVRIWAKRENINGSIHVSKEEADLSTLNTNGLNMCWSITGPNIVWMFYPGTFHCQSVHKHMNYVLVKRGGIMTDAICEIEIDFCTAGTYGHFCEKRCHCRLNDDPCDNEGVCVYGCELGFYGPGCSKECPPGTYGYDCKQTCNCLDKSEVCDKSSGECKSGCPKNTIPPDCHPLIKNKVVVTEAGYRNVYYMVATCVVALTLLVAASTYLTLQMNSEMKERQKRYKKMKAKREQRMIRKTIMGLHDHKDRDISDVAADNMRRMSQMKPEISSKT